MYKLSISIDMGANNNGVFVAKHNQNEIILKKGSCFSINNINFSKKAKTAQRHTTRAKHRRKMAKRLLNEIFILQNYTNTQKELLYGLLNNRGYTFLTVASDFEKIDDISKEFFSQHFEEFDNLYTKDDFEANISEFDNIEEIYEYIENINNKISNISTNLKEILKDEYKIKNKIIANDLKSIKSLYDNIKNELQTGAKPREKYFDDIKKEIQNISFIKNFTNEEIYNIVANISNLQLRVLRKYFNNKFDDNFDDNKLYLKIKKYFNAHHYKKDNEKNRKRELDKEFDKNNSAIEFLKNTNPLLTIPPYEDMNNRDTYKCNSLLINPNIIDEKLKETIEYLLQKDEFNILLLDENGEFKKDILMKKDIDYTYSKYLQRVLDIKISTSNKEYHPREVYKNKNTNAIELFKKLFGVENYNNLKDIATRYYIQEKLAIDGLFDDGVSIFVKCNTNTPQKKNLQHILLKPLYDYSFSEDEKDKFVNDIENYDKKVGRSTLKGYLKFVEDEYKKYQNHFYSIIKDAFEKSSDDKELKKLLDGLSIAKNYLNEITNKKTILNKIENIDTQNLSRVINILRQTYTILFEEISGFNKTCKYCTKENNIRSDETNPIAKRLLSDVAKPIDGMLDIMLDRLAYEVVQSIDSEYIEGIDEVSIILEQNRFSFEDGMSEIKKVSGITTKKKEHHSKLDINICPYTGENFDKGEYDHILPQSKEIYNSRANLIYCSSQGNKTKTNKIYKLKDLNEKHLKEIFKTNDTLKIEEYIKQNLPNKEKFKNFNSLSLSQQISLRYALFLDNNTQEYKIAKNIIKLDKLKTITNGTQKRLSKFIMKKLYEKYPSTKSKNINSISIDAQLVSAIRQELSRENEELKKEKYQKSHSHVIDAMFTFYIANAKMSGRVVNKDISTIIPLYSFDDIYISSSNIDNISKRQTYINAKDISSYKLFQGSIYAEHYYHIIKDKDSFISKDKKIKDKDIDAIINTKALYKNKNNKKVYINNIQDIEYGDTLKIDINILSNYIHNQFINKNTKELEKLKYLDNLRYSTKREEIEKIFIDKNKLIDIEKIKIPPYMEKSYSAIYKKLKENRELFIEKDKKVILNKDELHKLLQNIFTPNFKEKVTRKRGKKRDKYTLPILGQNAKFRVKRGECWQVLASENISANTYLVKDKLISLPYYSKNCIPVKIDDLINITKVDDKSVVYDVQIDTKDIQEYIHYLKYTFTEASRLSVVVTFNKNAFSDIDFDKIEKYDANIDEMFCKFIKDYIDNKDSSINKYIGSIRDGLKAKATLLDINNHIVTLEYRASTTSYKKEIALKNIL